MIFLDYLAADSYLYGRFSNAINSSTINMSALVYFQGWNSIYESLKNNILGIGFQFLGHENPELL
jgi:hypothetical protein